MLFAKVVRGIVYPDFYHYRCDQASYYQILLLVPFQEQNDVWLRVNPIDSRITLYDKFKTYLHFKNYYKRDVVFVSGNDSKSSFVLFCQTHSSFIIKPLKSNSGKGVQIINVSDESFSFDLSDKGVSYTDPMIMRFSALDDSFSINDLTINCNMSYMKFPYLFAEYYRERDEGLLSTFKGVPDGSKLYYVKAFDSNGDVVYLGYADKAINPETNREEYCWYSHDGIKATYTFANDSAQQGGFLGSVL